MAPRFKYLVISPDMFESCIYFRHRFRRAYSHFSRFRVAPKKSACREYAFNFFDCSFIHLFHWNLGDNWSPESTEITNSSFSSSDQSGSRIASESSAPSGQQGPYDPPKTLTPVQKGSQNDTHAIHNCFASINEHNVSTFVIYMPDKAFIPNDHTAVRPVDVKFLQTHVTDGGTTSSVHASFHAVNWVEEHYDTPLFKSFRSVGLGGPIATMLTPDLPALAIFGSILDDQVVELAKMLCDTSKFAVMIRPVTDDPLVTFGKVQPDTASSAEESDFATADESDSGLEESDEEVPEGSTGVFRLRGGARGKKRQKDTEVVDSGYIVPNGILRPDGAHRTYVTLHLQVNNTCLYDMDIISKTMFKFQTERSEGPHSMTDPITRPQVISSVDFKVVTLPLQVLVDRSYSNIGLVVTGPNSIVGHQYLSRGFDQPAAIATHGAQTSTQSAGSLAVGLASASPTITATISHGRTMGKTIQLADNKPAPPCYVKHQPGKRWTSNDASYASYDIAWYPGTDATGSPNPLEIQFGIGIELRGKEVYFTSHLIPR
ncbi:hypothetical protein C8R43DRAFT_20638 [Mycena crocata]|nr:hypothetical protein C8R43DRAFT_20638 [Mycena crocata]